MNETPNASAIFAPIWRRKWLILIVGILVAVGAYGYYKGKPVSYVAKTEVYLGGVAEEKALLNNTLGKTTISGTELANQVELINTAVGESVKTRLRKEHNGAATHAKAKAKSTAGSDFITITAEASTARAAAAIANAYAVVYIKRHQANQERSINAAIDATHRQIRRLETPVATAKAKGGKSAGSNAATLQIAALNTKMNQLEADLTVQGVYQVDPAKPGKAEMVAVSPKKNAIFGFAIGIVLAMLVVYIASRFDGRLRSLRDIDFAFQAGY